jgi:hypothetical protein
MSSPSLTEAAPTAIQEEWEESATEPPRNNLLVKCDAFPDPLCVLPSNGSSVVTVRNVLKAIHRRLHSPVDDDGSNASHHHRRSDTEKRRGPRRGFFDKVHCIDLLHEQHHFIGLVETDEKYWVMLFE